MPLQLNEAVVWSVVAGGLVPIEVSGAVVSGAVLSGGYRQRIALARAVYGDPSMVVLDEPSSNLDGEGDVALGRCIAELKQQGTTVVIVSHRHHTVGAADKLLLLKDGAVEMFGALNEVMTRLTRGPHLQTVRSA